MARFSAPAAAASPAQDAPLLNRRLWRTPLVVGICFGLGYGLTSRLLALQWHGFVQLGQSFDVRPFPGTSLERLRQRFGSEGQAIRADLDLIELEAQNRKAEEQARRQAQDEQKRLEAQQEPPLDADPSADADLPGDQAVPAPDAPSP